MDKNRQHPEEGKAFHEKKAFGMFSISDIPYVAQQIANYALETFDLKAKKQALKVSCYLSELGQILKAYDED
jgi:hypothetical protein